MASVALRVQSLLETCLYVPRLAEAEHFYTTVLGLEFESRQEERHVFLRCGRQMLLLFRAAATALPGSLFPPHGATGPGHVAFAVREAELPLWRAQLERHRIPIEKTIVWPNGGQSLYFRDPAGNSVELATPRLWGLAE